MSREQIWFIKIICSISGFLALILFGVWIIKGIADVEEAKITKNSPSAESKPSG